MWILSVLILIVDAGWDANFNQGNTFILIILFLVDSALNPVITESSQVVVSTTNEISTYESTLQYDPTFISRENSSVTNGNMSFPFNSLINYLDDPKRVDVSEKKVKIPVGTKGLNQA